VRLQIKILLIFTPMYSLPRSVSAGIEPSTLGTRVDGHTIALMPLAEFHPSLIFARKAFDHTRVEAPTGLTGL
jgi:hypothetical protein